MTSFEVIFILRLLNSFLETIIKTSLLLNLLPFYSNTLDLFHKSKNDHVE